MNDNLLDATDPVEFDDSKDYFAELVGPGKKFQDEKALAKGKAFADAHAKLLEAELADLKRDYLSLKEGAGAGAKLQELSDKIENQLQLLATREKPTSNEDPKPTLKLDDIENLVTTKIRETEQQRIERDNYISVEAKLKEQYGNTYGSVLKERAVELGLSDAEVNSMARKNPNLFIKTFDLNASPGEKFQTPPRNSSTFSPKKEQERTWSYYLEQKKKDPEGWLSNPQIRKQMEKDSQRLGEKFFDV